MIKGGNSQNLTKMIKRDQKYLLAHKSSPTFAEIILIKKHKPEDDTARTNSLVCVEGGTH